MNVKPSPDAANAGVVTMGCVSGSLRLADPMANINRAGEIAGPRSVKLRLVQCVAAVYPDLVLDRLRQEVPELAEAATRGKEIEWRRNDPPVHGRAGVVLRASLSGTAGNCPPGCGEERCARFAEAEALRAEVQRLRELVLEGQCRFEGRPGIRHAKSQPAA